MEPRAGGENEAIYPLFISPTSNQAHRPHHGDVYSRTGHVQDTVTKELRKALWEEQHFVKIRKKIIELRTKRKDFLSKRSSQGHVTL